MSKRDKILSALGLNGRKHRETCELIQEADTTKLRRETRSVY
jgi:hypothetical protein